LNIIEPSSKKGKITGHDTIGDWLQKKAPP